MNQAMARTVSCRPCSLLCGGLLLQARATWGPGPAVHEVRMAAQSGPCAWSPPEDREAWWLWIWPAWWRVSVES